MNYMPDFFHIIVSGELTLEALEEHFAAELCLSPSIRRDGKELSIRAGGGFCSVNLSKPSARLLESTPEGALRRRVENSSVLQVVSGPNHYYRHYLPIFCDVSLGAARLPSAFWLATDDRVDELGGAPEADACVIADHFSGKLRSLARMLADPDNESWDRRAAAQIAEKIRAQLPRDHSDEAVSESLFEGLRLGDEDDLIRGLLVTMAELDRSALLAPALLTEEPHWPLMELLLRAPGSTLTIDADARETLRRRCTSEEPWVRWAAAYALAAAGEDAPLFELLTEPEEVRRVAEALHCAFFFDRWNGEEDEFDDFDSWMEQEDRFTCLIEAIAALCSPAPVALGAPASSSAEQAMSTWESLARATEDETIRAFSDQIHTALSRRFANGS